MGWGPSGRERVSCACALCPESPCVCWRELGLHDNWPGRLAVLCSLGWKKERHKRSEEGAVESSQQVSELKRWI